MRCPMHGHVSDHDATTCPVTIRRTIAGEVIVGTCGQPLEDDWPDDQD
jgi:hypothetical protein